MKSFLRCLLMGSVYTAAFGVEQNSFADNQQAVQQQAPWSELLLKAEREFELGNFRASEDYEVETSKSQSKLSLTEKERLFLLQARLAFAFQRGNASIDDAFDRLAGVNPRATLDALKDPPQLFSRWQEAVARASASNSSKAPPSPKPPLLQNPMVAKIDSAVRDGSDFWLGLFPFGVGHFIHNESGKGATYLALETVYLLAMSSFLDGYNQNNQYNGGRNSSSSLANWETESAKEATYALALPLGFAGLWGYELLDMVPVLAKSNAQGAAWTRFALSFAPFGVAQYKNGERVKAIGLASTQATLLLLSGYMGNASGRDTARVLFLGSLLFGAYDGWRGHNWEVVPATQPRLQFSIFPFLAKDIGNPGIQALAQYRL